MPKGTHPNSLKNLKQYQFGQDASRRDEERERQSRGGKKSAETRAAYKDIREAVRELLTPEKSAQIADMLVKKTNAGNLNAAKILLQMMGSDTSFAKTTADELQVEKLKKEIA